MNIIIDNIIDKLELCAIKTELKKLEKRKNK